MPSTKGQMFDQKCTTPSLRLVQLTISGNLLTRKKTVSVNDNSQPNPGAHSLAEPPTHHQVVNTSAIAVMVAILFLTQLCSPGSMTSSLSPTSYWYWNHHRSPCQAQLAKSWTSYLQWITAIIKQCWNTEWDLITYRNVEIMANQGLASPPTNSSPSATFPQSTMSHIVCSPCTHCQLTVFTV